MGVNARTTTASYDACRLDKPNAQAFTLQVGNQTVIYQLNVPPFGNGENWLPAEGNALAPGLWNFDPTDWAEYGKICNGIRVKALDASDPGIVSIS